MRAIATSLACAALLAGQTLAQAPAAAPPQKNLVEEARRILAQEEAAQAKRIKDGLVTVPPPLARPRAEGEAAAATPRIVAASQIGPTELCKAAVAKATSRDPGTMRVEPVGDLWHVSYLSPADNKTTTKQQCKVSGNTLALGVPGGRWRDSKMTYQVQTAHGQVTVSEVFPGGSASSKDYPFVLLVRP
jgi:hypothetical protein